MKIKIEDLRLRTIIGLENWERKKKQDVVINIEMEFDGARAAESDSIEDTVNYKAITKEIIAMVESSSFHLLEKLADQIVQIILLNPRVQSCQVQVAKPFALRYADSVSITSYGSRP